MELLKKQIVIWFQWLFNNNFQPIHKTIDNDDGKFELKLTERGYIQKPLETKRGLQRLKK